MCTICGKQILESDQMITDEGQSIQCDKCHM
jgi:DNA-directed RNA polymerase subunit RPC12/RpoP